jgi:LytS/YehU family sensor histidine kinase
MEQKDVNEIDVNYYLNSKNIIMDFFYTIVISTAIALVLAMSNPGTHFFVSFIISQSFGLAICSIILLMFRVFKPRRWLTLILITFTAVISGSIIGLNIGFFILKKMLSVTLNLPMKHILQIMLSAIMFSGAALYFFITKSRLRHRNEMIEQERIKRIVMEKEYLSANLRMLQAQIEPHFLFNTLSNILSLVDTEPGKSKSMLLDLTKYLRTSLSRTLPQKTTLDQEIEMIKAYLNIQKIRMDKRLDFIIDVPKNLRQQSFPPMLLQPLVENAVKHGLEPKIEGGEIIISAAEKNSLMRIEVLDTGLGFSSFKTAGVGIANVRERLQLLFGEKGRLVIEENMPSGVRAVIEVPTNG